jgi:hypothetical protein
MEFPQVVNSPSLRANFLISIRDDVLAKLDHFKGPIPNLFDNSLRIEHLNEEAARAAIAAPIEKYTQLYRSEETRVGIEPALVEAVVNQVKTGQVILGQAGRGVAAEARTALSEVQVETPYLQLVMERLWNEEKRAGPFTLRLETLNLLGGADRIVRGHLEVSMSKLRQGDRAVAARIFYYLVTPSGTKIAHTVPDLAKYAKLSPAELLPVLSTLSSGQIRILRQVDPPPRCPDEPRYEIFHDALVPAILDWQAKHDSTEQRSPEWIETLPVGPSKDRAAWTAALRDKDDAILANLVERELPGVSLLEISSYINGLYHATRYAGTSVGLPEEVARRDVERVLPIVRVIRRRLGWRQCEVDIKVMRLIRRSGALSMVIGPGVTMNAGGPSWLEVVRLLLKIALEKGHEVTRQVPSPQNPPGDPIRFLEEGGGRTGWDRHVELLEGGRAR